jgi:hypothetical protein
MAKSLVSLTLTVSYMAMAWVVASANWSEPGGMPSSSSELKATLPLVAIWSFIESQKPIKEFDRLRLGYGL